jgi:hypothetical protein
MQRWHHSGHYMPIKQVANYVAAKCAEQELPIPHYNTVRAKFGSRAKPVFSSQILLFREHRDDLGAAPKPKASTSRNVHEGGAKGFEYATNVRLFFRITRDGTQRKCAPAIKYSASPADINSSS